MLSVCYACLHAHRGSSGRVSEKIYRERLQTYTCISRQRDQEQTHKPKHRQRAHTPRKHREGERTYTYTGRERYRHGE